MAYPLRQRISLAARILMGKNLPAGKTRQLPDISPEEVREARDFFPMDKFFIFGHARSGTTMLTRLIRVHPQVHCDYQAHFFTRQPLLRSLVAGEDTGEWLQRGSNRWNRGKDLSPVVLRAAADFILEREARRVGKIIVGDKSPSSLLDGEAVRLMHQVYPDGRLIYIVRDGRDAALSHRFQGFIDFPEQLSREDLEIRQAFASNPEPYLCGEKSIFSEKALRRAAAGWVRNVEETHRLGQELYGGNYLSLRYEALLANPWDEMRRIWRFLGASEATIEVENALHGEMQRNPDAEWQQQKAGDIARSLQKGKQGSWRDLFTRQDKQLFHKIAGATLETWGYPPTIAAD